VVTDEDRCIGCRACAYICPFGAPVVNPDSGKTMTCDLCAKAGSLGASRPAAITVR
jgi:Fe-S-cluster-containing dehydrogenase component